MPTVTYRTVAVTDRRAKPGSESELNLFYRSAGAENSPTILLLHGFPTSSHQYRGIIGKLADKYRVIAPDLPGFGFSDAPPADAFEYTFDHFAEIMGDFVDRIGLQEFCVYVFDYGAPVGFRLAAARPRQITAIISQNGNAYEEGLSNGWAPMRAYWREPTQANRDALRAFLQKGTTVFQYTEGEKDTSAIAPESYTLDQHFLDRPGSDEIQLDLLKDYQSNVAAYPRFHEYFREHQPPFLAVWGKNDPFFLPLGADAFRRDMPGAEIRFVDAGHFALESHLDEVTLIIRSFLARTLDRRRGEALFGLLDQAAAPPEANELLNGMKGVFGFVPVLGYALAAQPSVLAAYIAMLQSLSSTVLDPIAQQVAMVAASRSNAADYGIAVHATLAHKLGASTELVDALRSGTTLSDAKLEAVRRFASAIAENRTQVSDADVAALQQAGYDHRAAVAIALAAAAKTLVNTVAHLARPVIDPGFRIGEPLQPTS